MNVNERSVVDLVIDGLLFDGAHHKQWFLERILEKLIGEESAQDTREELAEEGHEWEDGVAP